MLRLARPLPGRGHSLPATAPPAGCLRSIATRPKINLISPATLPQALVPRAPQRILLHRTPAASYSSSSPVFLSIQPTRAISQPTFLANPLSHVAARHNTSSSSSSSSFVRRHYAAPAPTVDLLEKYEKAAGRKRKIYISLSVCLLILVIAALILWYGEGRQSSTEILMTVGALQDPATSKQPPIFHLRSLYEKARTNDHWMRAVQSQTLGLLDILKPYLESQNKDERIYAALLVSYIARGKLVLKKAVMASGVLDLLMKQEDIPSRVAAIITLSNLAQDARKLFTGSIEVSDVFAQDEKVKAFIAQALTDHEPLIQAYAKKIQHDIAQKAMGRVALATNDLLLKAFDYTQANNKETMSNAMKDAVNGDPRNAYLQFCQAYWFHLMGFAKEAKIAYSKALSLNPGLPDALYELGRINLAEFHPDRTAILWTRALQEKPDFEPIVKWVHDFEAKGDKSREDMVQLQQTMKALLAGGQVSLTKAAPVLFDLKLDEPAPAGQTPAAAPAHTVAAAKQP